MPTHRVLLLAAAFLVPAASAPAASETVTVPKIVGPTPWTSLALNNRPGTFRFAVVTDRTGGHREGVFEDAVTKLNWLEPEFVMSVGDFIEGYTEDETVITAEWDEFTSFIRRLTMPFFYVPGNHDFTNAVMGKHWKQRFGPDYYHFVYQNVLFLCLNTEDGHTPGIRDAQVAYAKKALAENTKVRWTLVFLHRPLWNGENKAGWLRVEELLKGRRYTVFAGHNHNYTWQTRADSRYITLATSGGGSALRGVAFGEFDHVAWVTMKDDGPHVANLLLEGIWPEHVVTESREKLIAPLERAAPLQTTILIGDSRPVASVPVEFRVTNDADVPLVATLEFRGAGLFQPVPARLELTISPNSVALPTVAFTAARPASLAGNGIFSYDWTATLRTPAAVDAPGTYPIPPLALKGAGRIAPVTPLPLAKAARPVTVDGSLAEWGTLPHACDVTSDFVNPPQTWSGPADGSFRFGVSYDANFVYVAVRVVDDAKVDDHPQGWPWAQDGVQVTLDARPVAQWGVKTGKDHPHLFAFMSPGKTAADTVYWGKEHFPAGLRAVCVRTPAGFDAEFAMPAAILDRVRGAAWDTLRVAVNVYDFDPRDGGHQDAGGSGAYLYWVPAWDGGNNIPGSGMFVRK